MKNVSRFLLFSALALILLTTACTALRRLSPPSAGTNTVNDLTASPSPFATQPPALGTEGASTGVPQGALGDLTATLSIPTATEGGPAAAAETTQIPGGAAGASDVVLLECQFCIDGMANALVVLPDTSTFEVVTPAASSSTSTDTGCNTVDRYNGRQIIICRSPENTSLNLNICTDGNNCQPLLVELQPCPLSQINPPQAGTTDVPGASIGTNTTGEEATGTPLVVTATPMP